MGPDDLGAQVRLLRARAGMSLRELSRKAGMSAAALSAVEHGRSSPTLATLHKVLSALGTGFQDFFAGAQAPSEEPVFRRAGRREARDAHRRYEFLFPQRADVRFELVSETIAATEGRVQWETHDCDMGGVVLSGGPARLEIEGVGEWELRRGDAFYVKAGQKHRATNRGRTSLRLITAWYPPRY